MKHRCKHEVPMLLGDALWCRYCGAIKLPGAKQWKYPKGPKTTTKDRRP